MAQYDVIMAGGGVMGCATAYFLLTADPIIKVAIVEQDPSYERSSTILSDGNLRCQFNIKENIQISMFGLEVLEQFGELMAVGDQRPDPAFRRRGNLFLTDEAGKETALVGLELQQALGNRVEWLDAAEANQRYPFIDPNTIAGGTFGADDGTMDPQAVLLGYKNKAVDLGAEYIVGQVASVEADQGQVTGVRLPDGTVLNAKYVVNSAGAWGKQLAQTAGIDIPVDPIMRHVFHIETTVHLDTLGPMIVLPTGLYFIHEHGSSFTAGKSLSDDPVGFDFTFRRNLFTEHLWEDLVDHAPAFEQLKVSGGWAGLYAVNTFDHNAILGEWPELRGFILSNGFSGHGFQQCHAVGCYLAELIRGVDFSLDLSIFSPRRILENQPVFENPHKIV